MTKNALTRDAFLSGRVHLWQPEKGYRAGVDPVFLAAAVPAKPGQTVLELGCGAGAALLCLHARVSGLRLTGVELQAAYAELARRNVTEAKATAEIIQADISQLPVEVRQKRFDQVLMNPPYFDRDKGSASPDALRNAAMGEATPLAVWMDAGIRRVGPKRYLTMIHRMERLPEVLELVKNRMGSLIVLPLAGRSGRPAERFILQARQEGRAPFRLLPPWVLHAGASHDGDKESYTAETRAILRDASALSMSI